VYDPSHFNDRLLLGLKGTMSEAELHVLRARLQGGILNKARRGEFAVSLASWLCLQHQQRTGAGPRQTGSRKHAVLFRDIPADRIGLRGSQSLPPEGASVSTTAKEGTEQRRPGVGGTPPQPGAACSAQSALYGRIRLRLQPDS